MSVQSWPAILLPETVKMTVSSFYCPSECCIQGMFNLCGCACSNTSSKLFSSPLFHLVERL